MVKLYENTFRNVNIAFANEMALLCDKMGLDIWEVIEAASTKPFGFMPFYPGPGPGGHCIPVDPHYLSWKARQHNFPCKFIELASSINDAMPHHVCAKTADALGKVGKSLKGADILLLGVAYKRDISDVRESPVFKLLSLFKNAGARIAYHDPHVPELKPEDSAPLKSVELTEERLAAADCAIILVDHSCFDYRAIVEHSHLVVDCRNVCSSISAPHLASLWSGGNGNGHHSPTNGSEKSSAGLSAQVKEWPEQDGGNGGNGKGGSQVLSTEFFAKQAEEPALADLPLQVSAQESAAPAENFITRKKEAVNSLPLAISECGMNGWRAKVKRAIDILVSAVCLVVCAPLFALVSLAVKAASPGPVFFRQQRVGKRGRVFWMYKFRSMYADAEDRLKSVMHLNQVSGPIFKIRNDPRITPLGNILRRTSIDELPQLWNVLKGEMSLVGPRPPLPREVSEYSPRERRRLEVKPGITCLWQVSGRSELSFQKWVDLDLCYIDQQSLLLDMLILARTPLAVLSAKGAY
jgi:lipopolysaccharide/colanic/teichoic acid biosynthesis glycosyltransferase